MRKYFKNVIYNTLILLSGILIGYLLLIGVYCIPISPITQNVKLSQELLAKQGDYPASFDSFMRPMNLSDGINIKSLVLNNRGFVLDEFTASLMLSAAASESDLPVYKAALDGNGYSRYWHGYLVFLKPLLSFFTYNQIRLINYIVLSVLFICVIKLLFQLYGKKMAIAFLFSIFMIWPFIIPLCLQYCPMAYTTLVALIVLLKSIRKWENNSDYLTHFFLIVGMCTSYFDLLTFPIVSYGLCMVPVLAGIKDKSSIAKILSTVKSGVIWCIGYVGMWAGKWFLATLVLGKDVFHDAITQVVFRSSGSSDAGGSISISGIRAILVNLSTYSNVLFLVAILGMLLYLICSIARCHQNICINILESVPYWFLILLPFIWYAAFKNHSYIHSMFTYRALAVSWFSGLYWLQSITLAPPPVGKTAL
ncbi:MAG: hypothetical protein MR016_10730 [Agathobacter sp.]|nr:hypothetical protein [Agathobacter sp.]